MLNVSILIQLLLWIQTLAFLWIKHCAREIRNECADSMAELSIKAPNWVVQDDAIA